MGDPHKIMPDASSIVIGACYMYGVDVAEPSRPGAPRGKFGPWTRATLAAGAYGEKVLTDFFSERGYKAVSASELPLKPAAVRSGIVCYGKNTIVHADGFGSHLKLSAVLTNAELECPDGPVEASDCADCIACLEACPTGALERPYQLEMQRCICELLWASSIPRDLRGKVGTHILRCGFCQDACPKNQGLLPRKEFPFELEEKTDTPELIPLILGDDDHYRATLPQLVLRAGMDTIRRNAIIAAGNSGDPAAVEPLIEALGLAHSDVRVAAAWALGRLGGAAANKALMQRSGTEREPAVCEEIEDALRALA